MMEAPPQSRRQVRSIAGALFLAVAALYAPALRDQFVALDDNQYVTFNAHVQAGISLSGIKWAFSDMEGNWHPVTWISHMLDCQIYGLNPAGHHLTNVLLHAANAVLVFLFLWRATARLWPAAFVAAAFALHPLRVESVAWVAERKDVLSAFFGLVTLIVYVRYARETQTQTAALVLPAAASKTLHPWRYYLLGLLVYGLGLMSKAMLVTWPFLLLLLDFWPLGRLQPLRAPFWKLLVEKVPFFAMSFAISVVTFLAQKGGGAVAATSQISFGGRILNAFSAFYHYAGKTFWPTKLAIIYPWTPLGFLSFDVIAGLILLVLGTVAVMLLWKTQPWAAVGWFWFAGLLVPVIGLIQVGVQAWADRYSYLPQIGLLILCVWAFDELIDRRVALPKPLAIGISVVPLLLLAMVTSMQLRYWRNTRTLFEHTVAVTRNNPLAFVELAGELISKHEFDRAAELCRKAIAVAPSLGLAYGRMADIYFVRKQFPEALEWYAQGRAREPSGAGSIYGMVLTRIELKDYAGAIADAREGLRRAPDDPQLMLALAKAFRLEGELDQSEKVLRDLLAINPNSASVQQTLANVLAAEGKLDEAVGYYHSALQTEPQDGDLHTGLGMALLRQRKAADAERHLLIACEQQPTNWVAASQLAMIFQSRNQMLRAVEFYRRTVQLQPDLLAALNNLAWILASDPDPKLRDGREAVRLAEHACELTQYKNPVFLGTLAAAYAEAGRFPEAVTWAEKSRDLALAAGNQLLADRGAKLADHFRAGKPFHTGE